MEDKFEFSLEERSLTVLLLKQLRGKVGNTLKPGDEQKLRHHLVFAIQNNQVKRNVFGLNPILLGLQTAVIMTDEIGLKRDAVIAILLYQVVKNGKANIKEVTSTFGEGVAHIIHGLTRINELYEKNPVIESDNFRNLLLSFAEDMRVILIMIADRVNLMRQIKDTENKDAQYEVSEEAAFLYAPLAHKLGLYKLKSELEDLSLKYMEHDAYYMIKENLNATKKARDEYIERFIAPIQKKLEDAGLKFHMKGRTKSIHSIWQKMKKQKCGFNGIYDLFAIRIILDSPEKLEKMQCWLVYSIITDMYQPNPKRLRDWLSIPKSNGYESLHITVLGPENKWVEVQIRTERMDEIAERGLAAHWRYKGVKGETGLDEWLSNIRSALENNDDLQLMDQFKMDLYEDEVFVFTPKGELFKFPKGATVLDFAYHIHSNIGNRCTGAKINDKNVTIRQVLHSGDRVEILTNSNQKPKQDWLNIVVTSRAKSKVRQALKEVQVKEGAYAKEIIERKFRNKKVDYDESTMAHLIKKLGFKEVSDFYRQIVDESLDMNTVIDKYLEIKQHLDNPAADASPARSADEFNLKPANAELCGSDDVLVIDNSLKGVDYSLAKCCHPIYGDPVFVFVTISGGIKIHRTDCPNAPELRKRFGYRIVKAKWSGKGTSQYSITLRVVGNDDISIVNNITSLISKDSKLMLRSINIDSNDGLFSGNITVQVEDTSCMESLIKKLRTIKGVKQVARI